MKYLVKIDRIAAWVLLAAMFVYFVTGFGMVKGIINRVLATELHVVYLPIIIMLAFVIHTSYAIHLALKRWRIWDPFTKAILILIYIIFVLGFIYVKQIY